MAIDNILSELVGFNPAPPTILHIDLNSCFATVEQQANPLLRGKPLVVAAYASPGGCILASSREAKRLGIATGMRVREGKELCANLIVLPPDPWKYRFVNRKLLALLGEYSSTIEVKSIDEMVVRLSQSPVLDRLLRAGNTVEEAMVTIANTMKERIKGEIGEWLTVSVGIAPNRYLAKIASGLHKPDGLDTITLHNIEQVLCSLELENLAGIKQGYGGRLRRWGITSPLGLYKTSIKTLKAAFASKIGYDWWLWLHGWESDLFDRDETKTIGHSYALRIPYDTRDTKLHQVLCQLVEKMGRRLRDNGYAAGGIHVSCLFADHSFWHHGERLVSSLFVSRDLYREAIRVLSRAPRRPVRILAVSCYRLTSGGEEQLSLLGSTDRKRNLTHALDTIADRWGEFVVFPARMLSMEQKVLDRIAFGGVKGLDDVIFSSPVRYESLGAS